MKPKDKFKGIPRKVLIMGRTVDVYVGTLEKGLYGLSEPEKLLISISDKQTEEQAATTLFHEAIHMALSFSGIAFMISGKVEEALVRMLESAFQHIVDVKKLQIKE